LSREIFVGGAGPGCYNQIDPAIDFSSFFGFVAGDRTVLRISCG
jgi:hypothetical protein